MKPEDLYEPLVPTPKCVLSETVDGLLKVVAFEYGREVDYPLLGS